MSLGMLLLRLIVGGIFAAHGYAKLFGGPGKPVSPEAQRYLGPGFVQSMEHGGAGFAGMLRGLGVPASEVMALVVGVVEFVGGLLLSVDMVVAIWKVHWRNGLFGPAGFEFPLSMLGGCLALLFAGPGKISIDALASALDPRPTGRRW